MKMKPESVDHADNQIQLALPTKIAGIVFWGMILVGILVTVFVLQVREKKLTHQYQIDSILLAQEVEDVLEWVVTVEDLEKDLLQPLNDLRQKYQFSAVELKLPGRVLKIGQPEDDHDRYLHTLYVANPIFKRLELKMFKPSLEKAILDIRKNMLLAIGALVFIFGLILQLILQKFLSRPLMSMVASAEDFAEGQLSIRFDDKRMDEFGYLATFINRALDSMQAHQRELEASRKALCEEKERAEVTLHSIMEGVITTTADGLIQYMNPVAERLSGWSNQWIHNLELNDVIKVIDEDNGKKLTNPINEAIVQNRIIELPMHAALIRHDGEAIPIKASAAPMRNEDGEVVGAVMVFQDVSHARRLARQLSYQASHDALTGLFNRRMFEEHLDRLLLSVQDENRHHVLCYIDLDQFKVVNDTCGHMAGDELLRQLAILLQGCIREGDVLARLGGDEFGVLLENCHLPKALELSDNICQQIREFRFSWDEKLFEVGASIGIAAINEDNCELVSIISAADLACYAAKDAGRNRVHVFEPNDAVLAEHHGQMHWATRINQALDQGRFLLYWQSVRALKDDEPFEHGEVLIRMLDDDAQLVTPDEFIPAAERYNLMQKLDRWVIQTVFSSVHAVNVNNPRQQILAINLSGISIADDDMYEFIMSTATEYAVDLSQICFEITETAAISNLVKATVFMKKLKKQGCRFALDDFGSGLSSFAYLKSLPVDYIKIDGAFVKDITQDNIDRAMVESIIRLARVMNIHTIAEWVQDRETMDLLSDMGVDFVQGYYVGEPEPLVSAIMPQSMLN